ncbi:hypothetical protein BJ170DRAFT_225777 [Xylariales sp. AK1849]|nr:hypothetical protein BJ170DRAFT_225777 [Xylariales sp. AK1849]
MSSFRSIVALGLMTTAQLVAGHAAIIKAVGDAGGSGMALGVVTSTPRDGTKRDPFQQDATRFKGDQAATFGETVGAGDNSLETGTKAIMAETGDQLPQVSPGGMISMTLHQVNSDGGGPYTCQMSADASGTDWTAIQVTQSPPGTNSRNKDGAATDFPMKAAMPAGASCAGTVAGQDNVCLVRCMNAAKAGPFGGVVPVQMANSTTPAAARRGLAMAIKRSEDELRAMVKRATSLKGLSPEEIDELRDDGEIQ